MWFEKCAADMDIIKYDKLDQQGKAAFHERNFKYSSYSEINYIYNFFRRASFESVPYSYY
jgi:hypothetical protein